MVYQDITRNKNIPLGAKGLYAYLSSFCGAKNECYPGVDTIRSENGISKETFYKYMNILVAAGVVEKKQISENGRFGKTIYKITHEVEITVFPYPKKQDTVLQDTRDVETNSNNILNINNILNNNIKNISSEQDKSAQNRSSFSIPLKDGGVYYVPQEKLDLWKRAYPELDVEQQLRKMEVWSDSHPKNKKTRRGVEKFITGWLSRQQNEDGTYQPGAAQQPEPVEKVQRRKAPLEDYYTEYLKNHPREIEDDPFK